MQNNKVGAIAVANTKLPRARFDFSADVHTSMDFGSVIPARCHLMIPGSKASVSSHERILCSPMLAPTMGRMSLKAYHNFVRLSDIFPNIGSMLSQAPSSYGVSNFVAQSLPSIYLSHLSAFVLCGAYLNVYKRNDSGADPGDTGIVTGCSAPVYSGSSGILQSDSDLSALGLLTKGSYSGLNISSCFNLRSAIIFSGSLPSHNIPLSNPENATFYPIDPSCDYYKANKDWYDLSDVTPDSADCVIPSVVGSDTFYLCFRLSDFGKRLRKILIGCGYQIDFTNDTPVSLLPLLAFYKSYFDVFGLTLYDNWESTFCFRLIQSVSLTPSVSLADFWSRAWSYNSDDVEGFFVRFVLNELSACFYTDEQDFVSAHTRSTAVSPSSNSFIDTINTDVDELSSTPGRPNIDVSSSVFEPSDMTAPNSHAAIMSVLHGQLDSELLKRLYRWTNRNTIAGRRIAELLRAQGLGSYVDECKSDFIGSFELPIGVFDGISQSDTFVQATDDGSPLGERFGNGQADSSDERFRDSAEKTFVFETNEFGYWITLFSVVPKGGYAETVDPTVLALNKWQLYNPEFDSLGYEFDPKMFVQGSLPFADFTPANGRLSDSFGLAPRYFRWKFARNVANGDFTRRGVRDSFAAYYLDKVIDVGSRLIRPAVMTSAVKSYSMVKEFTPSMLPIAGNVWRYPTRYPFISRFNRIFNEVFASHEHRSMASVEKQAEFELFSASDDNFIVHAIFNADYFAPMKPVADSFETTDDEHSANSSMGKA